MLRYAPNLSWLWLEHEPDVRFLHAASAGFAFVELLFPQELDPVVLQGRLADTGLKLVLFDVWPGNWSAGERGMLGLPGLEAAFHQSLVEAIILAKRLGTTRLNVLAGVPPPGVSRAHAEQTAMANLRACLPLIKAARITILVEAINTVDMPGYLLPSVDVAAELVRATGSPSVRLQLDQYHVSMAGDDPIAAMRRHGSIVGHVQVADVPGRVEPTAGRGDALRFIEMLERIGYPGWVGLEYRPTTTTDASLGWLPRRARAR